LSHRGRGGRRDLGCRARTVITDKTITDKITLDILLKLD
jgi:hypothetical protein